MIQMMKSISAHREMDEEPIFRRVKLQEIMLLDHVIEATNVFIAYIRLDQGTRYGAQKQIPFWRMGTAAIRTLSNLRCRISEMQALQVKNVGTASQLQFDQGHHNYYLIRGSCVVDLMVLMPIPCSSDVWVLKERISEGRVVRCFFLGEGLENHRTRTAKKTKKNNDV